MEQQIELNEIISKYIQTAVTKTVMRDRLEHDIGKLNVVVSGLLRVVNNKADREKWKAMIDLCKVRIGLNDLILQCLSGSNKPMTPREIRDCIKNYGSEASSQQNLLQSVHTLIKRMEGDRVKAEINERGDKVYRAMTLSERMEKHGVDVDTAAKAERELRKIFESNPEGMALVFGFIEKHGKFGIEEFSKRTK